VRIFKKVLKVTDGAFVRTMFVVEEFEDLEVHVVTLTSTAWCSCRIRVNYVGYISTIYFYD